MIEFWATLEVWSKCIIPIAIFAIVLSLSIVIRIVDSLKWNRKIKWLKAHNFERYLIGVSSFGNGAFYGWREKKSGKRIDERDLKHLNFSEFLRRMKD